MNMAAILFGVEARRPASYLLLLAAIGGVSVAGSGQAVGGPRTAVGFLLGGVLAVAALGAPIPAPAGHLGGSATAMAAMAARLGWPVIGGCLGALASPAGPSGPALAGFHLLAGFHSLAGFFLGAGFAAALVAFLERRLPNRADVASGALVITAGAGLAGAAAWHRCADNSLAGRAAVLVAVLAAIGVAVVVARMPLAARKPRGTGRLIASGEPARGRLDLVGMAAALTGMVVCLFLAPESAAANRIVAVACFVALAVPEATITPVSLGRGWSRLLESVPLRPLGGGKRIGMTDLVSESVGFHALLLGWPSLVALALLAGDRERSAGAIATVALLAGSAAVTWGVASLVRRHTDGGTALAAVVAVLVVVWMVVVTYPPG
jgi:hypothetical protein